MAPGKSRFRLLEHQQLTAEESLQTVDRLLERVEAVGGVFTLLWHNSSLLERRYHSPYPKVLDRLSRPTRYDWRADLRELSAPLPGRTGSYGAPPCPRGSAVAPNRYLCA